MSRETLKCPFFAAMALVLAFFTHNLARLTDCRNYARNAKARVEVASRPGEGMRVTIVFTRAAAAPEASQVSPGSG
jgi:hypothetical protein